MRIIIFIRDIQETESCGNSELCCDCETHFDHWHFEVRFVLKIENHNIVFLSESQRNVFYFYFENCLIFQSTFTLAQADDSVVRAFLLKNAPDYLLEKGALTGSSHVWQKKITTTTPQGTPGSRRTWSSLFWSWSARRGRCTLSFSVSDTRFDLWSLRRIKDHVLQILCKLRRFSLEMSERTRSMHRNLVRVRYVSQSA